jgi:deoxyribodipyrimidine photolyase-related protein
MTTLIPILGDQLSMAIPSLSGIDPATSILLMAEVGEEASYAWHHKAKLAFVFSAMRHHAAALRDAGWQVDYVRLDDADNPGSLTGAVAASVAQHDIDQIVVTAAGEWRVQAMLDSWQTLFGVPVDIRADTRFLTPPGFFEQWAEGRKQLRMEYFYRDMRRMTGLLLDGDQPEGGQWNYDAENRKAPPKGVAPPAPPTVTPNAITADVLEMVAGRFADNPGSLDHFRWAVTATDAQAAQDWFLRHALPLFGDYQDAMVTGQPFLWHSLLSPYLNIGLLDPLQLCQAVEAEYRAGRVPLNAAEGFIRQIIGWREYVRGIYWLAGPDYAQRNFLEASRPLPEFYWTGQTDLNCLKQAIGQTLDHGYAHHIQRLMITGNFALIAGIDPHAVHQWYLAVYLDAYEWVELPNTLGMSQFGDGGMLASKPYAASGAYVNRMSDYCGGCTYDVKARTGPKACPLNALYWDFIARNEAKLAGNARMAMPYRTWAKFDDATQSDIRRSAQNFLENLG